jgi:hypothetical protein
VAGQTDGPDVIISFGHAIISLKSCKKFPSIVGGHFVNWNFLLSKGGRNFVLEAGSSIP